MLLRHLRVFAIVAEEGSVLRAAARLRVAQPALSRQVRQLESVLGVALFERDRHGVRLTVAGRTLLDEARRVFARLETVVEEAGRAHRGLLGTVRIALARGPLDNPRVAQALHAVREHLPDVSLKLTELAHGADVEALRSGDIDIAICAGRGTGAEFYSDVLYTTVIDSVLLPATHALAANAAVTPAQLQAEKGWLVAALLPRVPELVAALGQLCLRFELVGSVETALTLVAGGRGWIATSSLLQAAPPGGTCAARVEGLHVEIPVVALSRTDDQSRLVKNARHVLLATFDQRDAAVQSDASAGDRSAAPASSRVELRQLRAFTVAIKERSLTRAARRLGLSQSAVSRQLQTLERDVGCALLRRPIRDITPTVAGQVVAKAALAVLSIVDGAITRARRMARGITGTCIIGTVPPELTSGLLATRLGALARRCPEVAVELSEMSTREQLRSLGDRTIDIGIAGVPRQHVDSASVTSVTLAEDPIDGVLLSASHPLAARAWVRPGELAGWPFLFILRGRNPYLYDAVMTGLTDAGIVPSAGLLDGPRILWNMIATSRSWTIAFRSLRRHPPSGLVAVPLEGLSIPWGLSLLWRRDESDETVRKVLDMFHDGDAGPDV